MKLVFFYAVKGYEMRLGPMLQAGAAANGDEIEMKPLDQYEGPEGDAGLICGVVKREILWDHQAKNHPLLYLDKGYTRTRTPWDGASLPGWWRLCWNATHPTAYLMQLKAPADRTRDARMFEPSFRGNPEGHIVLLGSSQKFHHTEGLPHPTDWARGIIQFCQQTKRMVIYRPKPSWKWAEPIEGSEFHHGDKTPVTMDLNGAFCSITYGSIACVDSVLAGIPCIVLGNGVARPVSSTSLAQIDNPIWASRPTLRQWFANLSYCQFTPAEIQSGLAWSTVKEHLRYASVEKGRVLPRPVQGNPRDAQDV